jgi:hypothetical protein
MDQAVTRLTDFEFQSIWCLESTTRLSLAPVFKQLPQNISKINQITVEQDVKTKENILLLFTHTQNIIFYS